MQCCTAKKAHFAESEPVLSIYNGRFGSGKRYNAASFFSYCPEIPVARRGYPVMKLHATATQQYQTVTAYDDAGVEINAMHFSTTA